MAQLGNPTSVVKSSRNDVMRIGPGQQHQKGSQARATSPPRCLTAGKHKGPPPLCAETTQAHWFDRRAAVGQLRGEQSQDMDGVRACSLAEHARPGRNEER